MSLIAHLDELRKRIIIAVFALAAGMAGCFALKGPLLSLLIAPLGGRELITLSPTESFMTVFKVAGYGGFVVASPVIIYQVWAFVAPGLKSREKLAVFMATIATSLLFLAGVVLAWYLVLPRGMDFLLNYEADVFNQQIQATRYFSFVAMFLLGFGIIFELPAMIVTLAWMGLVNGKTLRGKRRYAVLAGAVVSAVLTPGQDLFSMLAMFVPFLLLYEISILCVRLIERSRHRKQEAASAS